MIRIFVRKLSSVNSTMVRILNVAEKNDAAKSLADIMSRGRYRKREGLSKFNKIYEYEYNLFNQQCTMTMTSVSGHLLNYDYTAAHKKWNSCNPVALFDANVVKCCPENYRPIKSTLEREIRGCQTLVIWTDCDREGENIGYEIINVCKAVKPGIRVLRARFSEITHGAVNRALANLIEPDKRTSDAVDVRQELDLRIGAAFTRFQTLRLKKAFPEVLSESLVSYGSCQFPTLGFVVERYKQVEAFIPEPFWKIKVHHETDDGVVEFSWKRNRLFDYLACLVLYEKVIENPTATVLEVKSKPKSKWRPVALDTVELEKLSSRKLKIGAKETMKIAEKLYTQGFISYPRTETNIFPKDLDLRGLVEQQTQDNNWGRFASGVLERGPTPRNGNKSDQAHPPIHPLKHTSGLHGNERKIYEFIVRHFLACCSQDAQGHETTVDIDMSEEKFAASGLMIIARNYLDVYPYDRWTAKVIPVFQSGEVFTPKLIEMNQGETSPPSLLTEADLISLMDKHGIGTDATHAEHIETIKARMYVGVTEDGKLVPGQLGMGLVEGYDDMGFNMSKPYLRAELEADLKRICDGQKHRDVVLAEQIRKYREVFEEATNQALKIDQALSKYFGDAQAVQNSDMPENTVVDVCPCTRCQQIMTIRSKRDGQGLFLGCSGYPACRNAIWFPSFVLGADVSNELCGQCQPGPVRKIKFKFKRRDVPAYISEEYVGCIHCDRTLKELFDVRHGGSQNPGSSQRPSQGASNITDSGYSSSQANRSSMQVGEPRTPLASRTGYNNPTPDVTAGSGNVVCSCGEDAKLLTVRKEGPNKGRQFFACAKPQGQGCGFFAWADQDQDPTGGGGGGPGGGGGSYSAAGSGSHGSYSYSSSRSYSTSSSADSVSVMCKCGDVSKLLTVQKEGPNKGRQFHTCPKPRENSCNFFQWADEQPGGSSSSFGGGSYQGGSGRGRGKKQSSDQGATRKRKAPTCGICGVQGHTARSCKNK